MIPVNGVKVLRLLARRSLSSRLLEESGNLIPRQVFGGGCRRFNAGICNPVSVIGNYATKTGNDRKRMVFGTLNAHLGSTRSIHGTGPSFMAARDFYEVLGVSKNATDGEIKKAYYALAKQLHPDMNKDDPEAEKKFQEVSKAYEVLKDKEKRELYDQVGPEAFEQNAAGGFSNDSGFGGGFNPFDIFGNFSGDIFNMFRQDIGGQDVKVAVELSFMEAVQGCSKTITFQTDVACNACGGQGVPPGTKREKCIACNGLGMTTMRRGLLSIQKTCHKCGGAGQTFSSICKTCRGARVVRGQKIVKVNIDPGVDNNETIKVLRSGGADPDGDQPGDLHVIIKVREDPVFRRDGADIHVHSVLSVTQAILGGTVQVPTLTGNVVVKVRPGTQPGQKVVLKNKGIRQRKSSRFGDQYVHFNVSIPTNITPRQRELLEEFSKEEQGEYERRAAAGASR
ncbi:PREDICTED: chaperone protein dnaJ GFA2, mitochondrial-like [Tarenaya hassleriana]|uniref:chaperone protein dnaJ GFA2, mitochondrial-like n=1 Tax=Tarenaya hassleriana TaxID=28532 RepID=UPI00053C0D18|nr:PREDICTED: chaperone protein dnaJ GFA2, mitochondrial-like [Tarenaya hassleriana]XP_010557786.1 PREDICTED: chaperone protein dnaJ GFA2, mitochondrial-like [Tarenaya hassleriana]XP_010557787.1 PREDICTED: chaperone protein dnaJ GFA2, mitochondrial-like [Tarenaya hassleriana]